MELLNCNLTLNTTTNLLIYSMVWCTFLTVFVLVIVKRAQIISPIAIGCIDIGVLLSFINPSVLLCTYYYCKIAIICIVGSIFLHMSIYVWCFGKRRKLDFFATIILLYLALSVYQIYAGCFIGYVLIAFIVKFKSNITSTVVKEYIYFQ